MVNNHTFFQHPDLIRVLRMHENVMAVMMNTLGRRAQAQSQPSSGTTVTGQDGEIIPKEKVCFNDLGLSIMFNAKQLNTKQMILYYMHY